jgi:hypothetical protein
LAQSVKYPAADKYEAMARGLHSNGATPPESTMSNVNSSPIGEIDQLPADLQRLVVAIQSLPQEHSQEVLAALDRVVESTKRRRRILSLVQDALSQLRLDMKYLMFDLEATRRERDDYRVKLEEQGI